MPLESVAAEEPLFPLNVQGSWIASSLLVVFGASWLGRCCPDQQPFVEVYRFVALNMNLFNNSDHRLSNSE
jgi:hypothetical protein